MGVPVAVGAVYGVGMSRQGRRRSSVPPRTVSRPAGGKTTARTRRGKRAFDIDEMFARIEEAIRPFDKAAMFELKERGHGTLFEQLIACVISIRTFDEVSLPAALRLFEAARTPGEVVKLGVGRIDELIGTVTFHGPKAKTIHEIAERVQEEFGGELPCDAETLMSFRGVGPKCAHLALGVACGEAFISVDVHVHRVTNRWGYVEASSPEKTLAELEERLPRGHWIDINRLLVPFGKHICTGRLPKCSTCPVLAFCRQVGVAEHR
jgi:endonuclease III